MTIREVLLYREAPKHTAEELEQPSSEASGKAC